MKIEAFNIAIRQKDWDIRDRQKSCVAGLACIGIRKSKGGVTEATSGETVEGEKDGTETSPGKYAPAKVPPHVRRVSLNKYIELS